MNTRGPCSGCGSALAIDQRYCVECGTRVGPPLAMPYVPATPVEAAAISTAGGGFLASLPMPIQTATTFAALALGFGVVVGTAISPNLTGTVAGPLVVQQATAPVAEPEPAATGGGGAAPAPAADPAPEGTFFAEEAPDTVPTGGGGSTKEPKAKPVYASGVVVHANPVASSYSLASGAEPKAVHTTKALPALGTQIKVPVRDLANRTAAEDGKRQLKGQVASVTFSGVVSFNRDSADGDITDVYTVSTRGASMLVHSPVDATGTLKPPPVGSFISVTVEIKDTVAEADPGTFPNPPPPQVAPAVASCPGPGAAPAAPLPSPPVVTPKSLYEKALTIQAPAADVDSGEIAGVVQAVCPGTGELLLSADDLRESKADLFDPFNGRCSPSPRASTSPASRRASRSW